ncbi:hypothetical protein EJB05_07171, partial [Eragrostis curvula]
MAATSLSPSPPRVTARVSFSFLQFVVSSPFFFVLILDAPTYEQLGGAPRPSSSYTQLAFRSRHPFQKLPLELLLLSSPARNKHARTVRPATENNQAAPAAAQETAAASEGEAVTTAGNGQPQQPGAGANANGGEPPKRAPLTARERLRAARVLGKYAEPSSAASSKGSPSAAASKPAKPEFGSGVLDALREADAKKGGGGRRRSRLPEAPGNLFDDSKRGMPKDGWTWELPFGVDVFLVLVSFTLITTIMFGTAYLVWKLGAIHFNEY